MGAKANAPLPCGKNTLLIEILTITACKGIQDEMATERYFWCSNCSTYRYIIRMFDTLLNRESGELESCPNCVNHTMDIYFTFNFGLGVGSHEARLLDCFLPNIIASWISDDGAQVQYYPFLVVLESAKEQHRSVWFPYWHLVTHQEGKIERKYGQWAPFIDFKSFSDLLNKAKLKGYSFID